MPAIELDRLTAADNLYLAAEENLPNFYGSPGFAFVFEGDPPTLAELRDVVGTSLPQLPRLRHVVMRPPLGLGRPVWVDDPNFELGSHLHAIALAPDDAGEDGLQRLIESVYATRLDRNRAMWQLWLVSGLEGGRFALLFRTHHALGDGVVFAQYFTRVLLSSVKEAAPAPVPHDRWRASRAPGRLALAGAWARERTGSVARHRHARPRRSARDDGRSVSERAHRLLRGAAELVRMIAAPVPDLPALNPPLSPYRRVRWSRFPLEQLLLVKRAYGCTVNDVFLAMVAGALRDWLQSRGTAGADVEVGIPVSTAASHELPELGNRMSGLRVALPTSLSDVESRLLATRERTAAAKRSDQGLATGLVTSLEERLPAPLLRTSARLHTAPGLFNMFASNIPGPEEPLYLLGRELLDIFPVNLLMGRYAFVQTMISYRGEVCLTVVGNGSDGAAADAMVEALDRARDELVALATKRRSGSRGRDRVSSRLNARHETDLAATAHGSNGRARGAMTDPRTVRATRASTARTPSGEGLAAVFPGQGSQQAGMGRAVAESAPGLLGLVSEALGADPFEQIEQGTRFVQPAIFCRSIASWFELREVVEPVAFGGHSMGEVAALVAAGALDLQDGVRVIVARASLTATLADAGGMLAVMKLEPAVVERIAADCKAHVANYNSPLQVVVAGSHAALDAVLERAFEHGGQAVKIDVAGAFHSPAMAGANAAYAEVLESVRFRAPRRPVYCGASARPFTEPRQELVRGLTAPVRWVEVVEHMRASGVAGFVELEPGRVLTGLIKRTLGPGLTRPAAELLAARPTGGTA